MFSIDLCVYLFLTKKNKKVPTLRCLFCYKKMKENMIMKNIIYFYTNNKTHLCFEIDSVPWKLIDFLGYTIILMLETVNKWLWLDIYF